jgi:mersacidin/lichenicidin family type 2 lantibiotic
MNKEQTIRAWKDEDYRLSLSEMELSVLPEHPAGLIELADVETDLVAGGTTSNLTPLTDTLVANSQIGFTVCCDFFMSVHICL